MPKIQQVNTIDITPEKFVNACDETELNELLILADKRLAVIEREKVERPGSLIERAWQ